MAKAKKTEPAIEIKNIAKEFVLPKYQNDSLKQLVVHGFKRNEKTKHIVLNGVSFAINKGDFFGIVGRNGSGKSTLLKLICGIYTPTAGEIVTHGKITPFIELGVGFNPELSGRDNVYLNGALLGFNRQEMHEMYDEIVEFAELEEFMDLKLKNFSSGMQVRLAFSIAIKAKGDILVLDEVLAVGDEAFQRKCNDYFLKAKKSGKTVVLVTHSMDAVRRFCNKAVMLKDGEVFAMGQTDMVANSYTKENFLVGKKSLQSANSKSFDAGLSDLVPMLRVKPISPIIVGHDEHVVFDIEYKITRPKGVVVLFSIIDESSNRSILDNQSEPVFGKGKHSVRYSLPASSFNDVNLRVEASLKDAEMYKDHHNTPTNKTASTLAFTNDSSVCRFGVRGKDSKTFSILNSSHKKFVGEFINCNSYTEWISGQDKKVQS